MVEIIRCLEHEVLPVVSRRASSEKALEDRHLKLLASLQKDLPPKAFNWGYKQIKCGHFCGVVQLDDVSLEILPKIAGKEEDPGSCRKALIQMLCKAKLFKSHKGGEADVDVQKLILLDIFIVHFCVELQTQIVQGKLRNYVAYEEDIRVFRGRLLFDQQIKRNLVNKERLHCRYDELSEDILINQVIKFTLRLLQSQCHSSCSRKMVVELLTAFGNISDKPVTLQSFDHLSFDRTSARYKPLLEQCRLFIAQLNPDVLAGPAKAFSLLFDMNQLFESWLVALVKPFAVGRGLTLKVQGPRQYLARRTDIDKQVFQMKPDISLLDSAGRVIMIIDAKWKLLESEEAKLGVSQADMYQMLSYSASYGVNDLRLVYPFQKGLSPAYGFNMNNGRLLTVATVDVSDPDCVLGLEADCRLK